MKTNSMLLVVCLICLSCSRHDYKALEGTGNCPVMLELRTFGGFDLKLINLGRNDLMDLSLSFDGKYEHSLRGLFSVEKGVIKDSAFKPSDTLTLQFNEDISNLLYFKIEERDYVPGEIMLANPECSTKWLIK